MNDVVALALILILATAGYAAGRFHGQFGYRVGFRYGYRQGYFDGDRASWNRRRRDLQAAVASVLKSGPDGLADEAFADTPVGTTYQSSAHTGTADEPEPGTEDEILVEPKGRHARTDRVGDQYALGRRSQTEIRQRSARTLIAGGETGDR